MGRQALISLDRLPVPRGRPWRRRALWPTGRPTMLGGPACDAADGHEPGGHGAARTTNRAASHVIGGGCGGQGGIEPWE